MSDEPGEGEAITAFRGDGYGFLSNLAHADVTFDGAKYPSVEHAFQAAKTLDPALRARIRAIPRPGGAREAGNAKWMRSATRPDWGGVKQAVLLQLMRTKFAQPKFRRKLLATGDRELRGTGAENNRLGEMLMRVRAELRAAEAERRERPRPDEPEGPENERY